MASKSSARAKASSRAKAAPKVKPAAYWLADNEEECPHCEHTYAYEVEVRCARCDAPICPLCVVRARKLTVCPDCAKGAR